MKRNASALTLSLTLLFSMGAMTLQAGYCMPLSPNEHVYGDTVVYSIRGVNVTLTADPPENKAYNSTVAFTLEVLESFLVGGDPVNPDDYFVSRKSLGFYLISGVILDYDRARAINTLWIYWGDSLNKTHVEETKSLYPHIYGGFSSKSGGTYFGGAVLPELSQGVHNLTVWVRAEWDQVTTYIPLWAAFSKTITFTIDTTAPSVSVLSPENTTYKASNVPLNFTVNEPFSKVTYCLDGQENVTINENTTLIGLPNGDHNVTVYATDEFGNTGVSEIVYFSVEVPFPTTLVIASVALVAVASVGLLVYFKKRNH
jgi:hypothetical protein